MPLYIDKEFVARDGDRLRFPPPSRQKEAVMLAVTVSPKFQVVIPQAVRDSLAIEPGNKMQVIAYAGRIELIPVVPPQSLRGFLQGIDTDVPREADRV
jgi:AbrB family looped-hinge helix DNA binding protein